MTLSLIRSQRNLEQSSNPQLKERCACFQKDTDIRIVRPKQNENQRLISQSGLFTRTQPGVTIEDCVKDIDDAMSHANANGVSVNPNFVMLIKLIVPSDAREQFLKNLNLMNINALNLFPDLLGASDYCNQGLTMNNYLPPIRDFTSMFF